MSVHRSTGNTRHADGALTRRIVVLMFVVLLAAGAAAAAGDATLHGRVYSDSETPLVGADIIAIQLGTGRTYVATSNEEGWYEIKGIAAGEVMVTASMPGHVKVRTRITLTPGQETLQDFVLPAGAIVEELSVTSTKAMRNLEELAQVVTVVGGEEIERRRPAAIQEALQRTPNMTTVETNPFRARPNYRGLQSSRVLLVVDGERLNNSRIDVGAQGLSPSMIDVSQLEAVEVVGGAGSALYGSDALAGTINMVTPVPTRPASGERMDVYADFSYDHNARFKKSLVTANYATPKFAFRASFSQFDYNEFTIGDENITKEQVITAGEIAQLFGQQPNTWAVYDKEAGSESPDSTAEGINAQANFWYFFNDNHSLRLKVLSSQHDDIGFGFSKPPLAVQRRVNDFRDLHKWRLIYEGQNFSDWLVRVKASAYVQTYKMPQHDTVYNIDQGSSWDVDSETGAQFFTGNLSTFTTGGAETTTLNHVESTGSEIQFTLKPIESMLIITGAQYLKEESKDQYSRFSFDGGGSSFNAVEGKTVPNVEYENQALFAQVEWKPAPWIEFTGGLRWDNWESTATPTADYPVPGDNSAAAIRLALPFIPDDLGFTKEGVIEYIDSVATGASYSTDRSSTTGNLGVVFHLPSGFHPYMRWGQSYREPEATVRYLLRNFSATPNTFPVPAIPNLFLEPEEGESLDIGIRYAGRRTRASLGYFNNNIENFIATAVTPAVFFPGDASQGVIPIFDFNGDGTAETAGGVFFQRTNRDEVEIDGWEFYGQHTFPLDGKGAITASLMLSDIDSVYVTAPAAKVSQVETYYNQDLGGGYRFSGSSDEVPFGYAPDMTGMLDLRWTSPEGKWSVGWEYMFANDITEVDPQVLAEGNGITQYGVFASLDGYDVHTLRVGYALQKRTSYRLSFAINNIFDDLYFPPYNIGPSPGRSYVFGLSLSLDDLRVD